MNEELVKLKTRKTALSTATGLKTVSAIPQLPENLIIRAKTFFDQVLGKMRLMEFDLDPNPPVLQPRSGEILNAGDELYYSPDDRYLLVINSSQMKGVNLASLIDVSTWSVLYGLDLGELSNKNKDVLQCIWFPGSDHFVLVLGPKVVIYGINSPKPLQSTSIAEFRDIGRIAENTNTMNVAVERGLSLNLQEQTRQVLFSKFIKPYRVQDSTEYMFSMDSIPTEMPEVNKQVIARVQNESTGILMFGTKDFICLLDLIGWKPDAKLAGRGYRFLPNGYRDIVADSWAVIEPLTLVAVSRGGLQFLKLERNFLEFIERRLNTISSTKEEDISELVNNLDFDINFTHQKVSLRSQIYRLEMDSRCSQESWNTFICLSQDQGTLYSFDSANPANYQSQELPEAKKGKVTIESAMNGKYLIVHCPDIKKAILYHKSQKSGIYEEIASLDDISGQYPAHLLASTKELLVFQNNVPHTISLELFDFPIMRSLDSETKAEHTGWPLESMSFLPSSFLFIKNIGILVYGIAGSVYSKDFTIAQGDKCPPKLLFNFAQESNLAQTTWKIEYLPKEDCISVTVEKQDYPPELWVYGLKENRLIISGEMKIATETTKNHSPHSWVVNQETVQGSEHQKKIQVCYCPNNFKSEWELPANEKVEVTFSTIVPAAFLHWQNSITVCEPDKVKTFETDFGPSGTHDGLAMSPDRQHFVAFCKESGTFKLFSADYHKPQITRNNLTANKTAESQYFWFDSRSKYLFFMHGETDQKIDIISLENYLVVASLDLPLGTRWVTFWTDDVARFVNVIGIQPLTDLSSNKLTKTGALIHLNIPLTVTWNCEWGLTRQAINNLEACKQRGINARNKVIEKMLCLWSSIPPQIITRVTMVTGLMYLVDDADLFKRFAENILGIEQLLYFHDLLDAYFEDKSVEWMHTVLAILEPYLQQNPPKRQIRRKITELIVTRKEKLLSNELTRLMVKILILSRLEDTILGEPKNSQVCMVPVPESYKSAHSLQTQEIVKTLFKTNPDRLKEFRIYHTKMELDLANGSEFSCAFFQVVSKLSDEDLKGAFKPIIYYKWGLIYKFCLLNACMVWANNVLAYIYLGFLHGKHSIGICTIIFSVLLAAMEIESARSSWAAYSSGGWNLYDFTSLSFNIFSVIYNMASPAGLRVADPVNVWFRLIAVVSLGVTSVTWLRVFAPTRYMITMLMQVFFDFGPFLAILVAILMLYAYCWRLVEGLSSLGSDHTVEADFYKAILTVSNFIFGNAPDPLGDDSTEQYDAIKFTMYVLGNVVLTYVLLNFLIALISGTSARVTEDKDVYDVKELLPLIQDFDLVLRGKKRASQITETVGYEASYSKSKAKFLVLVQEEENSSELRELNLNITELKKSSEASLSILEGKFQRGLREVEDRIQQELVLRTTELEKKLDAGLKSMSLQNEETNLILTQILAKLNKPAKLT